VERIPYVIDNIQVTLDDVLNRLLTTQQQPQIDIATAYFSVRGYELLRVALAEVRHFRLLLGDNPQAADAVGLQPDSRAYLRNELNAEPLTEATQRLVEELIRLLRRNNVEVRLFSGRDAATKAPRTFLHAKCYLIYGGRGSQHVLFDYLNPLVGIVGSSNFTAPGLRYNNELNLVHKTLLLEEEVDDPVARSEVIHHAQNQPPAALSHRSQLLLKSEVGARAILDLAEWFTARWQEATDFKEELIALLESSKFGSREYTPYQIYLKALYEYFRDDLAGDLSQQTVRSAVELSEFQEDAVKKARRILARYDGVIVADSVGLGKTWIGKKLLEDYAYHMRQKALVICPASLRTMWQRELASATIAATVISQEALGQDNFDLRALADVDVILVDEAHNFRNRHVKRYQMLEMLLAANGRRGRDGGRKKLILLTATPINNNIFDLYNEINLFAGNDLTYFAAAGIGDLYKYFLAARRDSIEQGSIRIFNLLEEVVVRRTRQFIRRAYPEATINGKTISWPSRKLVTLEYDLAATYEGFYGDIVRRIDQLNLPHYNLESYKVTNAVRDDFELGRQQALVGIFKSRFLKRLESSIDAFRISIRRALEFAKTFDEYIQEDIVLDAASFRAAMQLLDQDNADDENGAPASMAGVIDESVAARTVVDSLQRLKTSEYNRRSIHRDLAQDIDHLTAIWYSIDKLDFKQDDKLQALQRLLSEELRGRKVIVFSYYKDTTRYLHRALTSPENESWRELIGNANIRRIDSGVAPADRTRLVERFAPVANGREEIQGTEEEIDILIATDVMSEGQNLQDCGYLINYDLHWNPTRMVQRAGRIDRLGSPHKVLTICNMFPEKELEQLLGLVESLTKKIDVINQAGFLDASVLGEVVTPRDFNTLRRIAEEDDAVIEEQESFVELASSEALLAELQRVLATEAQQWLTALDSGIHSGLQRQGASGIFFYFTAPHPDGGRLHFWRYYDVQRREILDNRYQIMQLIACGPETPRYPPPYAELNVFHLQEKVIDNILKDFVKQQAVMLVDKPVTEEQNIAADILRQQANNPTSDRAEIRELRRALKQPLVGASIQKLRAALKHFSATSDFDSFLETLRMLLADQYSVPATATSELARIVLTREDLHLVCYEYVSA
jgi:SNF2 family DNA or RNA helicase